MMPPPPQRPGFPETSEHRVGNVLLPQHSALPRGDLRDDVRKEPEAVVRREDGNPEQVPHRDEDEQVLHGGPRPERRPAHVVRGHAVDGFLETVPESLETARPGGFFLVGHRLLLSRPGHDSRSIHRLKLPAVRDAMQVHYRIFEGIRGESDKQQPDRAAVPFYEARCSLRAFVATRRALPDTVGCTPRSDIAPRARRPERVSPGRARRPERVSPAALARASIACRMASGIVTFTRTAFDAASGTETRNGTAPLLCRSLRIVSRRDGAGSFSPSSTIMATCPARASCAIATASSSVRPALTHPGKSGKSTP